MVESLTNKDYNPVIVEREHHTGFGDWAEEMCSPSFKLQCQDPATYLWHDWKEVQAYLMQTYLSDRYPVGDAIYDDLPLWIQQVDVKSTRVQLNWQYDDVELLSAGLIQHFPKAQLTFRFIARMPGINAHDDDLPQATMHIVFPDPV